MLCLVEDDIVLNVLVYSTTTTKAQARFVTVPNLHLYNIIDVWNVKNLINFDSYMVKLGKKNLFLKGSSLSVIQYLYLFPKINRIILVKLI